MMRRCLVTGGAGFICSHLVDRLVAENCAVTVLDNMSTGKRANLSKAQSLGDVQIVNGSVLDRRAIQEAYNREHDIEPATIVKQVNSPLVRMSSLDYHDALSSRPRPDLPDAESLRMKIADLEKAMKAAANNCAAA